MFVREEEFNDLKSFKEIYLKGRATEIGGKGRRRGKREGGSSQKFETLSRSLMWVGVF